MHMYIHANICNIQKYMKYYLKYFSLLVRTSENKEVLSFRVAALSKILRLGGKVKLFRKLISLTP